MNQVSCYQNKEFFFKKAYELSTHLEYYQVFTEPLSMIE